MVATLAADRATGSPEARADAYFELAGLCKDRGLNREAADLLREVLALVPGHRGATEELRVLPQCRVSEIP